MSRNSFDRLSADYRHVLCEAARPPQVGPVWAATWGAIRLLHFRALHLLCRFVGQPVSADFEAAWSRGCCDRFSVDERVLCEAGVRAVVGCTLVLPKWAPCLSFGLILIFAII